MGNESTGMQGLASIAPRRAFRRCPHCRAQAMIRSSEEVTLTVKQMSMICTNPDCGHTWVDQLTPVHTICPSQIPNPEVHIPPCPGGYERRHFRSTDPPEDPDQLQMFPRESDAA